MSVQVRNKQSEKGMRRRRYSTGLSAIRPTQSPEREQPDTTRDQPPAPVAPPTAVAHRRYDDGSPSRRRLHGPSQDTAVYSCHCGYVFEASVSTSVGCPHCGDGQAW